MPKCEWFVARVCHSRGLALIVLVFALLIVAGLASVGYLAASQQFRVGVGASRGNAAFFAAEAGLVAGVLSWDSTIASLESGATRPLASERLSSGAAFEVRLTRIDAGFDDSVAHYLMVSTGRARGGWGGRRQVALFLRTRNPNALCCAAALTVTGDLVVSDAAVVSGFDRNPDSWPATRDACEGLSEKSGPGVAAYGDGSLSQSRGARIFGEPATRRHAADRTDLLARADGWFADLAALADLSLADGTASGPPRPAVDSGGRCDRTAPGNWGAPRDLDHPCFDYLPIIHSKGDLEVGAGIGQGVLLVEGDLQIEDGFEFFGLIVVRGSLKVAGRGTHLRGAVIVYDADGRGSEVTSGARIDLSNCSLERALRGPKLYLPHPLAEFAWLEILE